MKQKDITYRQKLDELMLDIINPLSKDSIFVLVEGDSDVRLFRKLFKGNFCKIETMPGGYSKLEEAVGELHVKHSKTIGIRDADFIHYSGIPYAKPNIFLTDYHDMEMMMIAEDEVFALLMVEYTDVHNSNYTAVRQTIFDELSDISKLKWINSRDILRLNFASCKEEFSKCARKQQDFGAYLTKLVELSENLVSTHLDEINEKIAIIECDKETYLHICNGHDFVTWFSEYLKAKHNRKQLSYETIQSGLRIAYSKQHYVKTKLYSETQQWANEHNCTLYQ